MEADARSTISEAEETADFIVFNINVGLKHLEPSSALYKTLDKPDKQLILLLRKAYKTWLKGVQSGKYQK